MGHQLRMEYASIKVTELTREFIDSWSEDRDYEISHRIQSKFNAKELRTKTYYLKGTQLIADYTKINKQGVFNLGIGIANLTLFKKYSHTNVARSETLLDSLFGHRGARLSSETFYGPVEFINGDQDDSISIEYQTNYNYYDTRKAFEFTNKIKHRIANPTNSPLNLR